MLLTIGLCLSVVGQDVLPGSNLSLGQARAQAIIIVEAKVVDPGGVVILGADPFLIGMELEPLTFHKGKASRDELKEVTGPISNSEKLPTKEKEYLFFITELEQKGNFQVIKILPKTDEVLKDLKAP